MSLDVYLYQDFSLIDVAADIVEETGRTEIANELRQLKNGLDASSENLFSANITHNLSSMAREAGIYEAVWRPDENGFRYARDIIPVLEGGIAKMKTRPDYYQQYNAPNGWGLYEHFVPWVEKYLIACKQFPNALVDVLR